MSEPLYLSEVTNGTKPFTPRAFTQQEKDRAKRAADIINEAIQSLDWDQLRNCWMAFRLSDGDSPKANGRWIVYDSKQSAVKDQVHEKQCVYIAMKNLIAGAHANELLRFFRFCEDAYDAGMRLPDPDDPSGGPDLAPTAGWMDHVSQLLRGRLS